MKTRTLKHLYELTIVGMWIAFGLAGVLFVYDCCVLDAAGAIGNLIGVLIIFVLNVLDWPNEKRALARFDEVIAEEDADYESYSVEEDEKAEDNERDPIDYFHGDVTPEIRVTAAKLCRLMIGSSSYFGSPCMALNVDVEALDGPAQLARVALWSTSPDLHSDQRWSTAADKLETGWTP
jgi:hypothetical protein